MLTLASKAENEVGKGSIAMKEGENSADDVGEERRAQKLTSEGAMIDYKASSMNKFECDET